MTPEVQMLAAAALWTLALTLPIVVGRMATPGAVA